jgi:hypothetical protein
VLIADISFYAIFHLKKKKALKSDNIQQDVDRLKLWNKNPNLYCEAVTIDVLEADITME